MVLKRIIPCLLFDGSALVKTVKFKKILHKSNANATTILSMAVYSKKGMGVLINFPKRELVIEE